MRGNAISKWFTAGLVGLLAAAPQISSAAPKWGTPDQEALVALRCDVGVMDRSVGSGIFGALSRKLFKAGDSPSWLDSRPYLVRVAGSSKPIRARKKDDVFVFAPLEPGTYRIDRIECVTPRSNLPGEEGDGNEIIVLSYGTGSGSPPEMTVDVRAGEVAYLGALTLVDNTYPKEGVTMGDNPPMAHELLRSSKDAKDALKTLRKALKGTDWVPIMDRLIEDPEPAAVSDTTFRW